jgi:hypothetical protein
MEPQHVDFDQFGFEFDPWGQPGQFLFEFLPSDQLPDWAEPEQAIPTPAPVTPTSNNIPSGERESLPSLQESASTQNFAPPTPDDNLRAQLPPSPAVGDQFSSLELPNYSRVDEEVVSRQGVAHRSNFTSYGASVWDTHYPHIKQLYLDEFKSLEDTMKHMAENHSFRPS